MRATSKVTSRGRITVPAHVRRALGIGPGSVLEWQAQDGAYFVRRAGRYSSLEIHAALFDTPARSPMTAINVKEALRSKMRKARSRA